MTSVVVLEPSRVGNTDQVFALFKLPCTRVLGQGHGSEGDSQPVIASETLIGESKQFIFAKSA